jgi:hypothetical protein
MPALSHLVEFLHIPFFKDWVVAHGKLNNISTRANEVVTQRGSITQPQPQELAVDLNVSAGISRKARTLWQLEEGPKIWSIQVLPVEILQLVFRDLYTLHTRAQRRISAVTTLRLVCRGWNNAVLNLPSVWTTVLIRRCLRASGNPSASITRAGNLPLDVVLFADSFMLEVSVINTVGTLPAVLSAIIVTGARIRSLTIYIARSEAARLLAIFLDRLHSDLAITTLHLRSEVSTNNLPGHLDRALLACNLRHSLRTVRLSGRWLEQSFLQSLENLRNLEFDMGHSLKLPYNTLVKLLERASCLEVLNLGCVLIEQMPDASVVTPHRLRTLRSFATAVTSSYHTPDLLYRMFKLFAMPNLEALSLSNMREDGFKGFLSFLAEWGRDGSYLNREVTLDKSVWPRLRTLRFAFTKLSSQSGRFSIKQAYPCLFIALPAVDHLVLMNTQTVDWVDFLNDSVCGDTTRMDEGDRIFTLHWPSLRTITIGGHNHLEGPINSLITLASRRQEPGAPLVSLYIERNWLILITGSTCLKFMQYGVAVIPYDREDRDGFGDADW